MTPRPLPSRRFVVLSKRRGHIPVTCTQLLTEEAAREALDRLLSDSRVQSVQYALAELALAEQYR